MMGEMSEEFMALIHTAIPDAKMYKIPGAKAAIDKEWKKLFDMNAFGMDEVMEHKKIVEKYAKMDKKVHFGTLRTICHEKHSELPLSQRIYKGRVVFRGDIVKDADGFYAVFSEQGTSSSHMAATKFMDALARCPGNDGEDSDAIGAYTQVRLSEVEKIVGKRQRHDRHLG